MLKICSLRTKVLITIICCTFISILIVGTMAIYNSMAVTQQSARENIVVTSASFAKDIDKTMACIETGVNTIAAAMQNELKDTERFKTDKGYVSVANENLKQIALNCANNVEGAMSYYVRYNPDYTDSLAGVFGTKESKESPFKDTPCTDITVYPKTDLAHVGWYYIPVNNGKPTWLNPYNNANIGVYMISYAVPLFGKDGTSLGIAGMDVDFSIIEKQVLEAKLYESGYAVLVNNQNEIIACKDKEHPKSLKEISSELDSFVGDKSSDDIVEYEQNGVTYVAGYAVLQNGMKYIMTVPKSEVNATSMHLVMMIGLGMLITLVLGGIYGGWFSSHLVGPLRILETNTQQMASGDLTMKIDIDNNDEIGNVARAFNAMSQRLNQVVREISTVADEVASGSKNISDSGTVLASGATTQAASVEELSATISEINTQTADTAANAEEANRLTDDVKQMAESGNDRMSSMLVAMEDISESSKNISRIIKVIDEIAFQTNILALNAAVEAARAGQHGKGFAVVAEEVRNLAGRSAKAAKETTDIIEGSLNKIDAGTELAHETADALKNIKDGVDKVAVIVNDIAMASQKQSDALAMLNQGVVQVSNVVQNNSATAEESASASEELSAQAARLQETIKQFKV